MTTDGQQKTNSAPLRHAMILPSVAAKMIRKPLRIAHGGGATVSSHDLMNWPSAAPASPELANAIRHAFVLRIQSSITHLWSRKPGFEITPDNTRTLSESDRVCIALLLDYPQFIGRTQEMTVRDFKNAWPLSIRDTLGLLARIEAMLWATGYQQAAPQATGQTQFEQAASRISHDTKLTASLNWREELESITQIALSDHHGAPKSLHFKKRWLQIFVSRYCGDKGHTLQEVGDLFSMTRERVRQITEATLGALKSQPLVLPALDRLMAAAERIMPMAPAEANIQLVHFLGPDMGLQAALSFAEDMGIENSLIDARTRARTSGGYEAVHMLVSKPGDVTTLNAALSEARKDCVITGCTNFYRVAGLMALEHGILFDKETLETLISQAPDYRLINAESGWFVLSDSDHCELAMRVKKLMACAGRGVDLNSIAEALATDDQWFVRAVARASTLPPIHVLNAMISGWSWLKGNHHNIYQLTKAINPADVLSASELAVLEVITSKGGVAVRADIDAIVIAELGVTVMALSKVLALSPIIRRLDRAVYTIRGQTISPESLAQALIIKASVLNRSPIGFDAHAEVLTTTVKQSGSLVRLSKRVIYLPSHLGGTVRGAFKHVGGKYATIVVAENNAITGLPGVAESLGVASKAPFLITFDVKAKTYELPELLK